MHQRTLICFLACVLSAGLALAAAISEPLLIKSGQSTITFDSSNGGIVSVFGGGGARPILRSGSNGLWQARFQDGTSLSASAFGRDSVTHRFEASGATDGKSVLLKYTSADLGVEIAVSGRGDEFDFAATVKPVRGTVTEFSAPGRMQFDPAELRRFVSPVHPHMGVGAAFNSNFFLAQPADRPSSWKHVSGGPAGYARLFGRGLDMRDLKAAPTKLRVTEAGRQWVGSAAVRYNALSAAVTRPSRRDQVDLVLIDSDDGPFFAGSRLRGTGRLWRFGGRIEDPNAALAGDIVNSVVQKIAVSQPVPQGAAAQENRRGKLGMIDLLNGPDSGSLANMTVAKWRERLQQSAKTARLEFVQFRNASELTAALVGDDFLAILNPYAEGLPVGPGSTLTNVIDAIGGFVRRGGNWFEVGGYTFYAAMRPSLYLTYEHTYPPVFSDFMHVDFGSPLSSDGRGGRGDGKGSVSIFGVQARNWAPWSGATNHANIFVPGRIALGGDEQGGWCERAFTAYAKAGETWRAPVVRLALGRTAEEDIGEYQRANAITRKLNEKMSPELLSKFRQAVLVKMDGGATNMTAAFDKLPVPSLIHYSDYLKGGFDKEYPDHLPPRPSFGTPQELRAMHDRARALGHLIMPYTNPTWWCDHPRGPTFERAGEAPLQVNLNGTKSHEAYGRNDGWTITMWHPAVRAANDSTMRQFTQDYPVDILFQDQCGARGGKHDLNPASPTPLAYVEGMLSLVDDQSRTVPLSTEDGWDRVVSAEAQLCGFTFALGPGRRVDWAREMKGVFHPSTWEMYPFVEQVALDKAALLHHDLGKFVTDQPTLSWTLGLGFAMSYRITAKAVDEAPRREWLRWLDRIQKSICARYVGERVVAFEHRQGSVASGDDGVIRATYGPVQLVANLSPNPRRESGRELAAYGFIAQAPGMLAGNITGEAPDNPTSFLVEGDAKRADLWVFAVPGAEASVPLPFEATRMTVKFDDGQGSTVQVEKGTLKLRVPGEVAPAGRATRQLWHATVTP